MPLGASIGWYAMGLVDALEYIPQHHPQRPALLKILNDVCRNLLPMRDEKTKLWYLIVDKPGEKGNYLESSASAMFAYIFAKGTIEDIYPGNLCERAEETFNGLLDHLVSVDASGNRASRTCVQRCRTWRQSISQREPDILAGEPQRRDDFKGYGPFLLAAIELEKSKVH